jgi:predicted transcriptional regulator
MATRSPVSDAELEVLKVLWASGPATVREVAAALRRQRRRLAYNTVLTLLSRLRDKGYVAADRRDTAHLFRALVTRDDLLGSTLTALADRIWRSRRRSDRRRDRQPARPRARPRPALLGRRHRALPQAPRRPRPEPEEPENLRTREPENLRT